MTHLNSPFYCNMLYVSNNIVLLNRMKLSIASSMVKFSPGPNYQLSI